jgi:methionine-rich copper-binding protein CopC
MRLLYLLYSGLRVNTRATKNWAASAVISCCLLPAMACAHVFPKHQDPGAGASVSSPAQVRIEFDGPLEPAFSTLTVTDAGGKDVESAKSSVDTTHPDVMTVALAPLVPGQYTVHWAAVAPDGHRTHGDYAFEVK